MKALRLFFILTVIFLACGRSPKENFEETDTWSSMINDNKLTGWTSPGDTDSQVMDSVLSISGDWMIFDRVLEDFIFETEFQLGNDGTAVIAFRSDFDGKKPDGYMVNLDPNIDQQNTLGSIVDVSRAKTLKSAQAGLWITLAIEARGDHLKVFVNDTLVTETHDRQYEEGHIALKAKNNRKAQFKNMRIKALPPQDLAGPQIEEYMRGYDAIALVPLADTTNLDDWYQFGDAVWEINDGVIHGYSGEKGGFLINKQTFRNFYLKLKFKIKKEDNSGIFIRHNPEDSLSVSTDNAIECNIYDHNGFTHEFSTGAIAPIARSWSNMIDYESWNEMEIFAFEDQICMYVNGKKSSEAHLPEQFNQTGNICIQGGIQVFNGDLPSDIYIKDLFIKDFEEIPSLGF